MGGVSAMSVQCVGTPQPGRCIPASPWLDGEILVLQQVWRKVLFGYPAVSNVGRQGVPGCQRRGNASHPGGGLQDDLRRPDRGQGGDRKLPCHLGTVTPAGLGITRSQPSRWQEEAAVRKDEALGTLSLLDPTRARDRDVGALCRACGHPFSVDLGARPRAAGHVAISGSNGPSPTSCA